MDASFIIQRLIFYKNGINSIIFLYAGLHKTFSVHYILQGNFFKVYFNIFILHEILRNQHLPFISTKARFL